MKQSQGYLTGLQSQLAGQYGGLAGNYGGGSPSPTNNTFGWGSTVPHYSHTGQPYYQGNGTDTPVGGNTAVPRGSGGTTTGRNPSSGAGDDTQYRQYFDSIFPGNSVTPAQLKAAEGQLAQQGIKVLTNGSGVSAKIQLPNGAIVDVIGGAAAGGSTKQWYSDNGVYGGGGGSGGSSGGSGMMSAFGGGGMGGMAGGAVGRNMADYGNIMSRFQSFADNGGFSEGDKANIRSRAVSPVRSIYSSARQGLDRQRALQGGYSPGYATALGRFSREQGQLTSDAATNAEAAIAEMVQRGKLAGMGGMASIYGATPGLSNMFGNQMLQGMGQQLTAAGLQNQLSLGLMGNQNNMSRIPGNFQEGLNNIGGAINLGGQIGGIIYPWLGGGGGAAAGGGSTGGFTGAF